MFILVKSGVEVLIPEDGSIRVPLSGGAKCGSPQVKAASSGPNPVRPTLAFGDQPRPVRLPGTGTYRVGRDPGYLQVQPLAQAGDYIILDNWLSHLSLKTFSDGASTISGAMAPKKPPPPPPPPAQPEEVIVLPKFKAIPPEVKWRVIRLFGIFCFISFIASTVYYIQLIQQPPSPFIPPMETLRRTLANALRKPGISSISDLSTAEEVIQLPNYQEESEKAYQDKKNKYQSIYKKGTVKSSTHWTLFEKNLYYISIGRKTWYDAQNFCLSRDSHLVSILNDKEQKFITSQFNESVWIGLNAENDEGTWQWSDGSRLTVQFWDVGSPTVLKKYGEVERNCAFINPSAGVFSWKDDNCHALKQWACKEIILMEDVEYLSRP
ncbi:uncharacterized protein LOC131203485 isoform X2 [Ahaetulla prasina]|uniref:uncharacterized protein LOC131203485 isoform X2 n=1 Tax=Ahaetulla prasina TaxID=499056 RepID=UPI00264763A2|nr:uncharacterized protein LOC131203485 isoform X2 [Ahaetulla prasina]